LGSVWGVRVGTWAGPGASYCFRVTASLAQPS
jgi:hypothetical protein